MKKIIIDVRLLSKGGSSGIEEYTTNLIDHLLAQPGDHVYTLFYNGVHKVKLPSRWIANERIRVASWNIPNKLLDPSLRFLGVPRLETLAGDASLVFSPHFNIVSTNLPHLITFHDLSFLHHPDFFPLRKRIWHWQQGYKNMARRAAHCIAVSEFTKSDLMHFLGVPEEKISVIYSGIHPSFRVIRKESDELRVFRKAHNLARPFILYLGTLEPRKNIPALIRAFDMLTAKPEFRDFELVLAGRIGWLSQELFREARSARAARSIRFLGSPKSEERVLLYNAAEIFVYPSFFEGFGFQPLEAQACGVPVVASNRTSLPEILGTSARLIDPWSVEELCGAIYDLLTNKSVREAAIHDGLKNSEKFSWKKSAEKTLALYNQVV